MDNRYPQKLIKEYIEYMKDFGVSLSISEAESDLESLSIFFQSFALDEYHNGDLSESKSPAIADLLSDKTNCDIQNE